MRFSCSKEYLERAVGIAERFTGKNVALPVLGHLLLEGEDNTLVVTATNLEHAVQFRVPARVEKHGRVSVPAKVFSSLLQSFGDDKIEGEGRAGNLHLRTQTRESRLNGTNADDFPLLPKIKKSEEVVVDASALARGLGRVLPAVSTSEFKPELSGVYVSVGKDALTLCATDTFRLAECMVPLVRERAGAKMEIIVPHRAAVELARTLDGEEGNTALVLGDNQLLAETGRGRMISRLVEGNFPEYRAIIPGQFMVSSYISRNELAQSVRAASIFASKLQEVTLGLSSKRIEVAAANPEVGEYRTGFAASLNGKDISMSFNWRYLLDGVNALEDEEIFFGCNQESSPALLRNKSNSAFTYVVMPIRLT